MQTETKTGAIQVGDTVREAAHRVPPRCLPFFGTVTFIAPDGWIGVRIGSIDRSFPPGEVVRDA
jgi:hypothetical protein